MKTHFKQNLKSKHIFRALPAVFILLAKLAWTSATLEPNTITLQDATVPLGAERQPRSTYNGDCRVRLNDNERRKESKNRDIAFHTVGDAFLGEYLSECKFGLLNRLVINLSGNETLEGLKELRCQRLMDLVVICSEKPNPRTSPRSGRIPDLCLPFPIHSLTIQSQVVIPGVDNLIEQVLHTLTVNIEYYSLMEKQAVAKSNINILRITEAYPEKIRQLYELETVEQTIPNEHIRKVSVQMNPDVVIPMNGAGGIVNAVAEWIVHSYPKTNFLNIEDRDYSKKGAKILFCPQFQLSKRTRGLKVLFVNNVFIFVNSVRKKHLITPPLSQHAEFRSDMLHNTINLGEDKNYPCGRAMTYKEMLHSSFISPLAGSHGVRYFVHLKKDFMNIGF